MILFVMYIFFHPNVYISDLQFSLGTRARAPKALMYVQIVQHFFEGFMLSLSPSLKFGRPHILKIAIR